MNLKKTSNYIIVIVANKDTLMAVILRNFNDNINLWMGPVCLSPIIILASLTIRPIPPLEFIL